MNELAVFHLVADLRRVVIHVLEPLQADGGGQVFPFLEGAGAPSPGLGGPPARVVRPSPELGLTLLPTPPAPRWPSWGT